MFIYCNTFDLFSSFCFMNSLVYLNILLICSIDSYRLVPWPIKSALSNFNFSINNHFLFFELPNLKFRLVRKYSQFCVQISSWTYTSTFKINLSHERAQWLSGKVLHLRPEGCGFKPHWRHCVVVLEQDTFILA